MPCGMENKYASESTGTIGPLGMRASKKKGCPGDTGMPLFCLHRSSWAVVSVTEATLDCFSCLPMLGGGLFLRADIAKKTKATKKECAQKSTTTEKTMRGRFRKKNRHNNASRKKKESAVFSRSPSVGDVKKMYFCLRRSCDPIGIARADGCDSPARRGGLPVGGQHRKKVEKGRHGNRGASL